ncbi:MAG: hypothetical protein A2268_07025 [Candidatus Raymondbacteria bacterium RifOxyA12_full_50_37]|uniref:STAS domain-containing protein n=1 Tax=Candidatus Raymondbacteria bacterium RIFOXYD12_FULL_49_13 TaxID=1817890 RepID=A0A1F7FE99_UNCRA|nr:MAG: hypothetical protein A2268_07025 [Candidatus Raymondbacteria bacterium RifOxyA12_full_50_37]OGJ91137.1 MAG: hypothetical protein A2248_01175 [Candidatus Raymondbacteria bacterium RIFOXYA2_FULL_49_16]OGJ95195.1 MAG: hypothetical protein A2487_12445 [Candidatus Raymondbacteria bacterium RifOxyC12_full_50_8]OGJ97535.1 MAG: hypothetical protein A2453_01940 [Candidatus Raymondbacteria bacterium RIFOXYC2_FULL_50_21]OGK00161.1 MAG: hypothetical protein A2350_16360 [Candidatus Raymondbacteria b
MHQKHQKGTVILLCGVSPVLKRFFDKTGMTAVLGQENIFQTEEKIFASSNKAYEKARMLV